MAMENPLSSSGTLRCQQTFGDTCRAQIAKWGNWFQAETPGHLMLKEHGKPSCDFHSHLYLLTNITIFQLLHFPWLLVGGFNPSGMMKFSMESHKNSMVPNHQPVPYGSLRLHILGFNIFHTRSRCQVLQNSGKPFRERTHGVFQRYEIFEF